LAYIGNIPAESYASFETETFSVSATTNYTLSHAVTNENEIRLVINGVVQQPGSGKAYTASGTTLTLTSATVSGDVMYAVYLGRALQTVNPPNASVGTAQLADSSVTSAKLASGVLPTNTPSFYAYLSSSQDVTNGGFTKVTVDTEVYDTDNAYDNSSNYRFTPQTAGKYFVFGSVELDTNYNQGLQNCDPSIYKNGSKVIKGGEDYRTSYPREMSPKVSGIVELNGSSDYIELYVGNDIAGGDAIANGSSDQRTHFGAYKLIT